MLTLVPKIGVPPWIKCSDDLLPSERKAQEFNVKLQQHKTILLRSGERDTILQMVDSAKECGKSFFRDKRYFQAQAMYNCALDLAQVLTNFDVTKSQLHSNVALCWLRLDCPYECIGYAKMAVSLNIRNIRAHHHLASSLYKIYEFKEAQGHVEFGLKINPECIELLILKEKLLSNGIPRKFSQTTIKQRLLKYEGVVYPSYPNLLIPEDVLIKYDERHDKFQFLLASDLIISNKILMIDGHMKLKNFGAAYTQLVGLHHIYHVKRKRYAEVENSHTMFELYYKKALCQYYMEDYKDALENCNSAKEFFPKSSLEFLTLESKILYEMQKYVEALDLINKLVKDFRLKGVEDLILKEIIFKIHFDRDKMQTAAILNPSTSLGAVPAGVPAKKENSCKSQQMVPSNKAKTQHCDICDVDVLGPKSAWNEHLKGRRHKILVEVLERLRNETDEIDGALGDQTSKECLEEDSDDYRSCQSELGFESIFSGLSSPCNELYEVENDEIPEEVPVVQVSDACGFLSQASMPSKSMQSAKNFKKSKSTKSDEKQTATKEPSKKKWRGKTKHCRVCNVSVRCSGQSWTEHTRGKLHIKLQKEEETRKGALKKEPEVREESEDDSGEEMEECQGGSDGSSGPVPSSIDFEETSEVRDSDFGSQTAEENGCTSDPIRDKKLKITEDSWTMEPVWMNVKQAKRNRRKPSQKAQAVQGLKKLPARNISKEPVREMINYGSGGGGSCHGDGSGSGAHGGSTYDNSVCINGLQGADHQNPIDEFFFTTDVVLSEAEKWEEMRKIDRSEESKERTFIIDLPPSSGFPLKSEDYNVGLACASCMQRPGSCSDCRENLPVVRRKPDGRWIAIRERTGHGHFYGSYRLCRNSPSCFRGSFCSFPHSEEEMVVWNAEKQKRFSLWNFVKAHRSKSAPELNGMESICDSFPGTLTFVCGRCYLEDKSLVGKTEDGLYCSEGRKKHNWNKQAIMIHRSNFNESITLIFQHSSYKTADSICRDGKYCNKKDEKCLKPHSFLELQIWRFLEEKKCSELEFAEKFNELSRTRRSEIPKSIPSQSLPPPPHPVRRICSVCWSVKTVSFENVQSRKCTGIAAHPWTYDGLFYLPKANKPLRHLPKVIPRDNEFKICWNVQDGKPCKVNNCQFAHCKEELETWRWMARTGNHDPGLLAKRFEAPPVKTTEESAPRGIEFVSQRPRNAWNVSLLQKVEAFKIPKAEKHYCPFCDKCFSGTKDLEVHRNTSKHMENVKSDSCTQWNHRMPPYASEFRLCRDHEHNRCYYSDVPDERNFCTFAHGQSELDEWNERSRWKKVKFDSAGRDQLLSAASKLTKAYEEAEVKSNIMVDRLSGLKITLSDDPAFRSTKKDCQHVWTFEIKSEVFLKEVYLLKDQSRKNFSLLQEPQNEKEKQHVSGALLQNGSSPLEYKVYVKFQSKMFGYFSQMIIFDFGGFPVVFRTLKCEVGSQGYLDKLNTIRLNLNLNRWTLANENVTRHETCRDSDLSLSRKYPSKDVDDIMSEYPVLEPLHKDVYRRKMHGLLYLEELSQTAIISRYNLKTTIELRNVLESQAGGLQICSRGELFGKISLENQVIEGSLMLKSVNKVWFKPLEGNCQDIFEAPIPEFEDNPQKNVTGDSVIILFCAKICEQLSLKTGEQLKAEVQFQLDRDSFCRMHYAVDHCDLEFLCPTLQSAEVARRHVLRNPELNEKQNQVLAQAFTQGEDFQPPLVLFGAFGTGKTETLAKTSMALVTKRLDTKILICTKSNMTADEYFKRYFCATSAGKLKAIRIYNEERRMATVDAQVRQFCLINRTEDGFRMPTMADVKDNRILVTTLEMSFYLRLLGDGFGFTHIFVDEAGQDLECRTIIPLMLADRKTQIIIAGDHMQMGEELFDKVARDQSFGRSLMERLLHQYAKLKKFGDPLQILFNENYRNHKDILAFISKIYYGNALVSKQEEQESDFKPMEFFVVEGKEEVNKDSASIYNLAEVEEIVERVSLLYDHWPAEWGERNASQILVTSPYMEQVRYIRTGLRRKARGLAGITVIRVQNVPGLEFRAVFASSVRTSDKTLSYQYETGCNDEGFLTQPKLLNSVFTRAKSYLAVVGDPVVLCSTGECSKIWIEFLKKCQELNTINPPDWTLNGIKDLCYSRDYDVDTDVIEGEEATYDEDDDDAWNEPFQLESDEIIKQLVLEYSNEEACGFSVTFQESLENGRNGNIGSNSFNHLFSTNSAEVLQPLPNSDLENTYKCQIRAKRVHEILAVPFEPLQFEIVIPTRKLCNTALDGDEALVRIINPEDMGDARKTIKGEVVTILKRRVELEDKMFVCFVDEENVDLMIPINRKMPLIKIAASYRAKRTKAHVSIYRLEKNKTHLRDVPVHFGSRQKQVFLVKLLRWEKQFNLPLGIVLSVMKPGTNMPDTMKILDVEYDIPKRLGPRPPCMSGDPLGDLGREDVTDALVFTIDGEETEDIDDAIGFETLDSETVLLSIHISDVSYYVAAGSPLDSEARQRATSFYPPLDEPIHMLPENIGIETCSLSVGRKRRALSIFMKLDGEGKLVSGSEISIKRTLVQSKHRLTYEEVESILMNDGQFLDVHPRRLVHAVKEIYKITNKWRSERLGSDAMEWEADLFASDGPNARELIAELMIRANKTVARFLLDKFPDCTPLRIQVPPDREEMERWREEFRGIALKSTGLRRFFKTFPEVCRCREICTCNDVPYAEWSNISVPLKLWDEIVSTLETQRPAKLRPLVHDLDKIPQTIVANSFLKKIQERSEYVCSGDAGRADKFHFSLNADAYTHFTSPIRRYVDIVVHRLVIDAIENRRPTHSRAELSDVCRHCTYVSQASREYEKAARSALLCTSIQDRPLRINTTITKIGRDFEIELHSMELHSVFRMQLPLKPAKMGLIKLPEPKANDPETTVFSWKLRVYDNPPMSEELHLKNVFNPSALLINIVPADQRLLFRATELEHVADGESLVSDRETRVGRGVELSSESRLPLGHFCSLSMDLQQCSMMTVQLTSKLNRGLLAPFVQMVPFTELTNVCIEHQSDPVQCFSMIPSKTSSKDKYLSLNEYKHLWRSVLSLEAAQTSIDDGVPAIIHNVAIGWNFEEGQSVTSGSFRLEKDFCALRGLANFKEDDEESNQLEDVTEAKSKIDFCSAYVCVQYPGVTLAMDGMNRKMRSVLEKGHPVTLTFHCLLLTATRIGGTSIIEFHLKLKHHSAKLTDEVKECMSKQCATVEWMEQSLPMRRMFEALEKLSPCYELASKIVLSPFSFEPASVPDVTLVWQNNNDRAPNSIQRDAIKMAMNSSFSLIQGPPGTGKTFVVAQLVDQFYRLNENTPSQVMCCGPSNKSADVIATALLKLNPKMEILRIYGESKENKCYPLPIVTSFIKEKVQLQDERTDESLKDHTLHHLIRNEQKCCLANQILEYEEKLRGHLSGMNENNEESYGKMLKNYKALKRKAEKFFIARAKVIIITCTGVGAGKLRHCSIKQLLIDECGMCTEPESMVPIVGTEARHVVLIGDHKQLRPIIMNKAAAKLGLETSLFQRHHGQAFMLTTQYRMHEAIAEFPSQQFYGGRLTTGRDYQRQPSRFDFWPGGRNRPIAFVHLGGTEESLSNSTEEGGLQSKKNTEQANLALKLAFNLVHHHKVNQKDIIIMSQYRSQCTTISRLLRTRNLDGISVSTVISAQGSERKYVILSTVRTMASSGIERSPSRSWREKHLGFVTDPHQINVALTRAEEGLIILGNKELLSVDKMWRDLINHYEERRALVTVHNFALLRH